MKLLTVWALALAVGFASMFAYVDRQAFQLMARRDRRRLIDFGRMKAAIRAWMIERRIAFADKVGKLYAVYQLRRLGVAAMAGGAGRVAELKGDAVELLAKAKLINDDESIEAGDRVKRFGEAFAEYETAQKLYEEADIAEQQMKQATDLHAKDHRDPNDAQNSAAAVTLDADKARTGIQLADGKVVQFADEKTEGWIKGYPADVQLPDILRRLTPKLQEAADFRTAAFFKYCRHGKSALDSKELKALQEGTDSEGGFLVPTDAVRLPTIMAKGVRAGRMRSRSSVFTTSRDAGDWPTVTDDVTWAFVAEEAAPGESDPTFGQVPFTIRKALRINRVATELLEDSAVNIPALLGQLFTNGLGRTEDQQGIEGDGTTEPLGLRTTGAPQGDIADFTDLITLAAPTVVEILNNFYELPEQWRENASWFFTSSFMARLAAIGATAAGIHVFQELLRTEPTPSLLGKAIFLFDGTGWDDAATIAANEELGAFGDFANYFFVDRVGMSITRLDELYQGNDQIGFKARVRYDSFFAENDAFRIIKAAAA